MLRDQRICIVDWRHLSLPKDIPAVFNESLREQLEIISKETGNIARGVHTLGLLQSFVVREGSNDCEVYEAY